ncbi:MAG TPA: hypothetical protein V6D12_21890 [Candidatus Obscuribacterales bacterium]
MPGVSYRGGFRHKIQRSPAVCRMRCDRTIYILSQAGNGGQAYQYKAKLKIA